jgi:hypothetical protein
MVSLVVKKHVESKYGQRIRYSRDCDGLAAHISAECRCKISGSTVRRLLGFYKTSQTPRTSTLDIIAEYVGHKDWDELISTLNKNKTKTEKILSEITAENIKKGEKFELGYKPDKIITIEYIGKAQFKVLNSKNSKLKDGDLFKAYHLTLHHPLFLLDVCRDDKQIGELVEAKVSGITSIKKL